MKTSSKLIQGFIFGSFILLTFSCQENKEKKTEVKVQEKSKIQYVVDTFYNNYAQRVAALDTTPFNDVDAASLVDFSNEQRNKINQVIENRLSLITTWNKDNMARNKTADTSFVFYPFSGADFIHVYYLYPQSNEYFMSAIEKAGSVIDINTLNKNDFFEYLRDFDTVMRDIYMRSYFITKNMEADFGKKTKISGVLPILLWSAAKTNHDILSVKYFILDDSANKKYVNYDSLSKVRLSVEIKLFDKTNQKFQVLNYFCTDLSNQGLTASSKSLRFMKKYVSNASNGFVKSASYLMHYYNQFGTIQNLVLTKNKYLVQDDTGVPFSKFSPEKWNYELFGKYEKPIKDFTDSLYQPNLDQAYQNEKYYKGELKFSLGYHWNSKNQNQMVFIKK